MKIHRFRKIGARAIVAMVALACIGVAPLRAQTCAAPIPLFMPNQTVSIDTCMSSYNPGTFCEGIAATGPAVVFSLALAYPAPNYSIVVTPAPGFDVAFGVESSTCSELALCPYAIDNGPAGATERLNLGNLDSGQYYVVVTSFQFVDSKNCGQATVTLFSSDDNPPGGDGIFRRSFDY